MLTIDRREGQILFLNDTVVKFKKLIDKKVARVVINDSVEFNIKLGMSITVEDSELIFLHFNEFIKKENNEIIVKARFGIKGGAKVVRGELK